MDEELKKKLNTLSPQQLKVLMSKMGKEKKELPKMAKNPESNYSLTSAQKRMWFLSKLDSDSFLYVNPIALRLKTKASFELDLYIKSFTLITDRHEIMRTSFSNKGGQVFQIIHDHVPVDIKKIDLRSFNESDQKEMIENFLSKEGQTTINVEAFPLFRHSILQLSDLEYVFIYISHHIISDGWSNSRLFRQVLQVYDDMKNGRQFNLPSVKYQFIDYVNWENNWLQSPEFSKARAAWKSLLPAEPEPLNLPFDYIPPAVIKYEGALEKRTIGAELVLKAINFSKSENVNLFHTLLSVFNILLHKYSGNEEIVVGIPFANRNGREFQETLGLFMNTLPHKTTIDDKVSFRDYLKQVKNISQDVLLNQEFPFEKLIEEIKPKRNLAVPLIFQVLFVYQNIPSLYEWGGMKLSPEKTDYKISKYPLNLWLEHVSDELFLSMTYQTSLFKQTTINRFFKHFEFLLNEAVSNPETIISDLKVQNRKVNTWSIESFTENTYLSEFEKQAVINPDQLALKYLNKNFTYKQLNKKANQISHYLNATKNKNDIVVGMILDRSDKLISSIIGINKSGCAYLPIDPSTPSERLNYILQDAKINYIVTETKYKSLFEQSKMQLLLIDGQEEAIQKFSVENPETIVTPNDLVYMIYTSGSTGVPKGVCIEHRQLLNYSKAVWERIQLDANSKFAIVSSIATDLGNTQIFPALIAGASVDIIAEEYITNAQLLAEYISENQIDCLKIVPSLLSSLLSVNNSSEILPKKLLILGGERVSSGLIEKVRQHNKELRIMNHYGPTETTIGVLTHEIHAVKSNDIIPLGRPLKNNIVFIADKKNIEVPNGIAGEVIVCGNNVGRGYNNNEQLTATVFIDSIDYPGLRCYKTGDLGRKLDDGTIEYLGRIDRQVKIRGYRVELEGIERVILKNEKIAQAVVLSQKENSLVAFIIPFPGKEINASQLKQELKSVLPDYMIPADIIFLDFFPRLGNGKIDVQKLKEVEINQTGKQLEIAVSPRDEVELIISLIWKEILKIDDISINDNFFDAGGNSLIAIELIGNINSRFSINLPIGVMFEYNTISLLALFIRNTSHSSNNSPLVSLKKGTSDTTIFFVHPAGGNILCYYELAQYLPGDYPVYGLQSAISDKDDVSIREIAKHYLEVVRKQIPDGTCVFAGWSMGALVAYEMAVQLEKLENKTSPVIILDQKAPGLITELRNLAVTPLERLVVFAGKVEHLAGRKMNITKTVLENLSTLEQSELFLEEFKKNGMVPGDLKTADFHGFLEKMILHNEITMDYRAEKYNGNVLLIKADDSTFATKHFENEVSYGWSNYAEDIEIVNVPGNHITMMKLPNVKAVADKIKGFIPSSTQLFVK